MHTLEQLRSGELEGSRRIKLTCGLTEFPRELFSLADTLEELDLSGNCLSRLPDDLDRFRKLKIAFFSDNLFTELPAVLGRCERLSMIGFRSNQITHIPEGALPRNTRWLILANNKLTRLPRSIGKCELLQKVGFAGNQLHALPEEMANCRNLELLRISANQLSALPDWLLDLPKLSWLGFGGNPFSWQEHKEVLQTLDWNDLEVLEQLGQGASGHIFRARWKAAPAQNVAIKVFKGELTSDGVPEDEMKAAIAAGEHPNLVKLLGKIKRHPEQKQGLVMELIARGYGNLGLPPSLESCSRDVFAEGTCFSLDEVLAIIKAIASVLEHLHRLGLNHGDLYAHNILADRQGNCLLSDFGAASFYDPKTQQGKRLQQIEVRAFGCLLEDLLMHLDQREKASTVVKMLEELKAEMLQPAITRRPLFSEISTRLLKAG